jgi:protein-tyrosine phosphatase
MIDLHSHILPALDDGARSIGESCELARQALEDGVTAMAATPHVRSDFPTSVNRMERGVAALRHALEQDDIPLDILTGGEIDLGMLWQLPVEALRAFSLGGSRRYVLVEFPYSGWPRALDAVLAHLHAAGLVAVLVQPERNSVVQDRPADLKPIVEKGALVQVTSSSVDGRLGRAAQHAAKQLIDLGLVHLLATDAHGPHIRLGGLAAAAADLGDETLARRLTQEVPAAIVAGEDVR